METQKAALNYERACSQHQSAKLAVAHAEQKLESSSTEHKTLDPTWQEMLNRAIMKVSTYLIYFDVRHVLFVIVHVYVHIEKYYLQSVSYHVDSTKQYPPDQLLAPLLL